MTFVTAEDLSTLRTKAETAVDLHISLATLKRIIAAGDLATVRIGNRVFISRYAVLDYLNRHHQPEPAVQRAG